MNSPSAARRSSSRSGPGPRVVDEKLGEALRRERARTLRPLGRLLPFLWTHPLDLALGALFVLISSGSILAMTDGVRRVIDGGLDYRGEGALARLFVTAAALALTLAISTGLRLYFTYKLGQRVVADMRKAVFRHVLGLDLAYFAGLQTGEVLSRLTTDMTMVEQIVGAVVPAALRNAVTLAGALGWMVIVSPDLTGLVLLLIPVLLTPLFLLSRRLQRLSLRAQDRFAEAVGQAGEGLGALDTVQAFGQEDAVAGRFNVAVESAFEASRAQLRAAGLLSALMITLIFGGMLGLLFQSAVAVVVRHTLTAGRLVQLLGLAFLAANAVKDLAEVWGQLQKASGASARLAEMIDAAPAIRPPARALPLPSPPRGEVAFEDVSFAYPGRSGPPALDEFTLRVRPGERIALVGPSGAGKSTVFRLLLRFYDPGAGRVRIDGVDLREADPAEVRARLALVAQEAPLFSGTARDNIAFGASQASDLAVLEAARSAQARDFIEALPQGFDTVVGEHAKSLSGGQRQRLAIARALVRHAPILLLDEATSALDAENERLVQAALDQAMAGRTTLVIAHRLATVLKADRIVVMEKGRVVEEGPHDTLVARGGLYAHLARLQFAGEG